MSFWSYRKFKINQNKWHGIRWYVHATSYQSKMKENKICIIDKIAILPISIIIEKTRRKHNIITCTAPTQRSMYYFDNFVLHRIKIYTFIRNFSKFFKIFWYFFHVYTIFFRSSLHMYEHVHDLSVVSFKLKRVLSVIPEVAIIW